MKQRKIPDLKPLFLERMQKLLPNKKDFQDYLDILKIPPIRSIRCNTLKINPLELKKRLETKGWKITQPWENHPEIIIVEGKFPESLLSRLDKTINLKSSNNNSINPSEAKQFKEGGREQSKQKLTPLEPGELGRALEHLLGYYYIQELASMLPIIALDPKPSQFVLDLCASPGSKTTQIATEMKNTGTIIANEVSLGRIKILASNLERCGTTNTIITRKEGSALCKKLAKQNIQLDKILVDAPCSGEGTLRSSLKTYIMWNIKTIKALPRIQKNLLCSAFEILKPGGELIYSTCTHAPEENEEVVDFALQKFKDKIKIEEISLPIKTREGLTKWQDKEYNPEVKKCARIYPQDNNTEGFFIAKMRKVG